MFRIVGFGGTTRAGSSTERLTAAVLAAAARRGAETRMFGGEALEKLPHYAPERPDRTADQLELVAAVRQADALVIGTPGYHAGISGLVKNALDLLEDLGSGARSYLDGLPVGIVVSAGGWQAGGVTLSATRDVVHALRGWPTPIGITVNASAEAPFSASGAIASDALAAAIEQMVDQLMSRTPAVAA